MAEHNTKKFFQWLEKSKLTEHDIIKCRKMQSFTISETSNAFGITTISASGFYNNDYIQLGPEIKQQYAETREDFYDRVFEIYYVCGELMDAVNDILQDEGSWSDNYFRNRIYDWRKSKYN